jgi:hypothetical protein
MAVARTLDEDELVGDELALLSNRRAPTKLAFALMLRFYALHGRFPKGRHELPDQAVGYVARLVKVSEADLALYEWDGRTSKEHRSEIRRYFGFRECGLADSDKAALWLAANVCDKERQADRVREALLDTCGRRSSNSLLRTGSAASLGRRSARRRRRRPR